MLHPYPFAHFGVHWHQAHLYFLMEMNVTGSSKYADSPLKCNYKVSPEVRAGGKRFGLIRASLCSVSRGTYKVCATNADPALQVMLGLVGA